MRLGLRTRFTDGRSSVYLCVIGSVHGGSCGCWGRSRFASGTGPSSWAPASSGRYSRCSRWSRAGRCRPTGSRRACGATSCRRARRRWCSSTSRTCGALLDGDGVANRHPRPRLRAAAGRAAMSTPCASSGLLGESRPREALALWRGDALADLADEPFAAAEIRRLEELRAAGVGVRDRRRPRGRSPRRGDRRARRAGRRAPAARAPARPADARALSRRPPVRGAGGLPRRARARSSSEIGVEPGAELRRLHERSSPRIRRSTCPRRPSRDARAAAAPAATRCSSAPPRCCSPASPRSASSACSSPRACRASTRTRSG